MALQPTPTTGSITFLFHVVVIIAAKLRHHALVTLAVPLLLLAIAGGFYASTQFLSRHHETMYNPISRNSHDEKTEPITSTDFVKTQHFYAWLPWWDEDRIILSLQSAGHTIEVISPVWYKLSEKGTLAENPSKQKQTIIAIASRSGTLVFPAINNESDTGFDSKRVSLLLHTQSLQTPFISSLIAEAKTNGFIGWDIDWEEKDAHDKDAFNSFIKQLSDRLHQNGLKLAVTVQAKTDESDSYGDTKVEDWKTLAASADEIRVMAYDFHYDKSDPGAITPLDDLEAVLDYAEKTIPKDKIVLGVPLYGYDWNQKGGVSVQYADGVNSIKKYNGTLSRDPATEELVGIYSNLLDSHTLWFTDKKSVLRILYIANNYDINKIAFWRLGGEDQQLWQIK